MIENTAINIKNYLNEKNIKFSDLLLFGSRSLGTNDQNSDYDLCLLIDDELSFNKKSELESDIYKYLLSSDTLLPIDLIIKQKIEFEKEAKVVGSIANRINSQSIAL
jgi:predicted nucleotidyltransferase